MDGVFTTQHGIIMIMTTNYIEKLGSAFTRAGRIDSKFKLDYCNKEQIIKMTSTIINNYFTIFKENEDYYISQNIKYELNAELLKSKIEEFADKCTNDDKQLAAFTPSSLQVYILRYIKNIDDIFNNYDDLKDNYTI